MLVSTRLSCPLFLFLLSFLLESRHLLLSLRTILHQHSAVRKDIIFSYISYTISTYLIYDFDVTDGGTHNRYQDVLEAEVIEIKRGCVRLRLYFTSGSPVSGAAEASGEKCRGRPYTC